MAYHAIKKKKMIETTVESWTSCDKCGERIDEAMYEVFECSFEYKEGNSYPSGGSHESQ